MSGIIDNNKQLTVAELIALLEKKPQHLPVYIPESGSFDKVTCKRIYEADYPERAVVLVG